MARSSLLKRSTVIIAGVAVILTLVAYGRAKEKPVDAKTEPAATATSQDMKPEKADTVKRNKATSYWIGVRCVAPIPEMVRVHVEVPKDSGLFVADVVPKGPAAKAGIVRHDIILAANGSPLKKVADLTAVIGRSQDKPLTLEILRSGKRQDIKFTPQRRPAEFAPKSSLNMPPDSKWHKLGKWFDENHPGTDGRPPLKMRFMHPGIILPPGSKNQPLLSADTNQAIQPDIQKQLDTVDRQIKQLNKLVEDLRQERLLFNKQK